MNYKKVRIIIVIILLGIFLAITCQKNYVDHWKSCESFNLVDSLIQDVINKTLSYSYDLHEYKVDVNYIISTELIPDGKVYKSNFVEKVLSVNKNKFDSLDKGIIILEDIKFNFDSTNAKIRTEYYLSPKLHVKTNLLEYYIDTVNCKWILKDSTLILH